MQSNTERASQRAPHAALLVPRYSIGIRRTNGLAYAPYRISVIQTAAASEVRELAHARPLVALLLPSSEQAACS